MASTEEWMGLFLRSKRIFLARRRLRKAVQRTYVGCVSGQTLPGGLWGARVLHRQAFDGFQPKL